MSEKLTWSELVKIEPELLEVQKRIKAVKDPGNTQSFCANNVWYGRTKHGDFREDVYRLVGWEARSKDPRIMTAAAFDLAYKHLYKFLPPCRNCICF